MKITTLIENTKGKAGCACEHGLSFYIETKRHTVLMDTGQSALFLENAARLGADLTKVDTVVISHGHYDHGGGLPHFMKVNDHAAIYLQKAAADGHYSVDSPEKPPRYNGLAPEIIHSDRITWLEGDLQIDDELAIFAGIGHKFPVPSGNAVLRTRLTPDSDLIQDDFRHEQCLVISQSGKLTLLSGCAHHGILNILDHFRKLYGRDPDHVISGFHMMKRDGIYTDEDVRLIRDTARILSQSSAVYFTGHCTEIRPYEIMREIMGDQLQYVHCGDVIDP